MEEHLASSLTVQKPCQILFMYVPLTDSHHWQPLAIVDSLNTKGGERIYNRV